MSSSFTRRSVVLTALALPALAACSGGADVAGSGASDAGGSSGAAADAFPAISVVP